MKAKEKTNEFRQGLRDGVPIALGYFAVSFTFGMEAAADGISAPWAALISLLCVSSAGQFAGIAVMAAGGSLLELALTQLVINLRYLLMSFSLSTKLSENSRERVGTASRLLMAQGVTDEIYAISVARPVLIPWYTWGAMCAAIPGWVSGALIGGLLGDILPGFLLSAFGVAIYGMFLAIILPPASQDRGILGVVLVAMALRTLLSWTPALQEIGPGFSIILVTVVTAGAAAFLCPRKEAP